MGGLQDAEPQKGQGRTGAGPRSGEEIGKGEGGRGRGVRRWRLDIFRTERAEEGETER